MSSLIQSLLKSLLSLGLISTLLFGDCKGDPRVPCSLSQYFDSKSNLCTACSSCDKDNEVIKQICSGDRDTVCGPFYEFSVFLQNQENLSNSSEESINRNLYANLGEDTWYILTLVLIGCLCVTSVLLVVLVIIAVLMYRRRTSQKQSWTQKEGQ